MQDNEFQAMLDQYSIFNGKFDLIRVVDPLNKRVLEKNGDSYSALSSDCFAFWGKDRLCDNCISIRAYNNNRLFIKFEYADSGIFLIIALPYDLEDRRVVIELLTDATDSLFLDYSEDNVLAEIRSMVDNLNRLTFRDTLTGVFNRRFANEKIPIELANHMYANRSFSLIMADIDYFKAINDTYGHLAGDEVLKVFAKTLSDCLKRESDWIARYGGEEFLICLPGARADKAAEIAEIMRKAVEERVIFYGKTALKITASFGVAASADTAGVKMDELLNMADIKLYAAKKQGRNRVEV